MLELKLLYSKKYMWLLYLYDLIDNNLFQDDDTEDLKIYPNSYIKLSDNSYCQVYTYNIETGIDRQSIRNEEDAQQIIKNIKSIFNSLTFFIK